MTSGLKFARAVYSAAVYPAGPLPMMITFSTSDIRFPWFPYFTLYSECSVPSGGSRCMLLPPALHGAPQTEVCDDAGDHRQPERHGAEQQHGHDGLPRVDPEARERRDHPALDAA